MLLCGNSSSRSLENFHVNPSLIIESLPTSLIPVEDSDPVQEEIDIFTGLDGLMLPCIKNDDYDSKGDIHVEIRFEPDTAVINNFDVLNKDACFNLEEGEIDVLANIEDNDSFKFVIRDFLPYLTYPMDSPLFSSTKNEDTIFDPGIST
ncbi:hypothetical protein Tco_1062715 [Tanacetum coccineum]